MNPFYETITTFQQFNIKNWEITGYFLLLIFYYLYFYLQFKHRQEEDKEILLSEMKEKYLNKPDRFPSRNFSNNDWNSFDIDLRNQLLDAYKTYNHKKYEFKDTKEKMTYFEKHPEELLYFVYFC